MNVKSVLGCKQQYDFRKGVTAFQEYCEMTKLVQNAKLILTTHNCKELPWFSEFRGEYNGERSKLELEHKLQKPILKVESKNESMSDGNRHSQ